MEVFKYKISMADNGVIVADTQDGYVTVTEMQDGEKNTNYIKRALECIASEVAYAIDNTMSTEFVVEVRVKDV